MPKWIKLILITMGLVYLTFLSILGYQDYNNGILIDGHAYYWLLVKTGFGTLLVLGSVFITYVFANFVTKDNF